MVQLPQSTIYPSPQEVAFNKTSKFAGLKTQRSDRHVTTEINE